MTGRPTVLSPCIGVCIMDVDSGYCCGCRRTLEEITFWPDYDDERRLQVLEALERRAAAGSAGDTFT